MSTLVLLLSAPMQSWGERAAFGERDTLAHPSRSGLVGVLASALGQSREDDLSWAQTLLVHVRADSPGQVMSDYHTVGGGYPVARAMVTADGKRRVDRGVRGEATLTRRAYLADATFTAAMSSQDDALIDRLAGAVRRPRWALFLGRKSCPPALPLLLGTAEADPLTVLATLPAYTAMPRSTAGAGPASVAQDTSMDLDQSMSWFEEVSAVTAGQQVVERTVYLDRVPAAEAARVTRDTPVSFSPTGRTYSTRNVGEDLVSIPAAGTGLPAWVALRDALGAMSR